MSHCLHYGLCGGCAYTDRDTGGDAPDKRQAVIAALQRAGYAAPAVAPLQIMPLRSRRRADLGVARQGAILALGLHQRGGGPVVDMRECVLLEPAIFALLTPSRRSIPGSMY
jgi:23S rRNA (uracil1939-C5)-methyltransferase